MEIRGDDIGMLIYELENRKEAVPED